MVLLDLLVFIPRPCLQVVLNFLWRLYRYYKINSLSLRTCQKMPTVRNLLSECSKLYKLILNAPRSVGPTAERSFSLLRQMKNYLRSTMGQSRLTHLMMIHLHRAESILLDKLGIFCAVPRRERSHPGKLGTLLSLFSSFPSSNNTWGRSKVISLPTLIWIQMLFFANFLLLTSKFYVLREYHAL